MIVSIEELSNNLFLINKEYKIYAPNITTAINKYKKMKEGKDIKNGYKKC